MELIVEPTEELSGQISPAPSKFYTQFAIASALLAEGKSVLKNPLNVDNTRVLAHAIEKMGATVERRREKWFIWGVGSDLSSSRQIIDAKKSLMGLTLLTSLASLSPHITVVSGSRQLRSIPMAHLIGSLQKFGVDIHSTKQDESPPLVILGKKLSGGKISFEEGMDPFFLPAVLLISPFVGERVELVLRPDLKGSLLDVAVEIMREAGADVSVTQRRIKVGPESFKPFRVRPPLDMASIAPYVTAAILTGSELQVSKISESNNVPWFIDMFSKIGVNLEVASGSIKIPANQKFRGRRISLNGFLELFPFISVLACAAKGSIRIINAEQARKMKCDRISAMAEGLGQMGADVSEHRGGITVRGPVELKGGRVDGHGDDTVVAALGVAGIIAKERTVIENKAEVLRESYPRFVSIFQDLGAKMSYHI